MILELSLKAQNGYIRYLSILNTFRSMGHKKIILGAFINPYMQIYELSKKLRL